MHQRSLTLGLTWLSMAALLALLALLWSMRGTGSAALDAAILINALLLPLPPLCAARLRRGDGGALRDEAAAEARMRLLAQISHEIRTPMNTIMGMTQLALQTSLSAEQRDLLTKADTASRMMLGLVNDLLDVARIEAGQMQIEHRPLRLEDVVAQAIELVRPVHTRPAVSLVCDWDDAGLLGRRGQLVGDAPRLQQVLVNLLSNALKFTPAGEVRLRLSAHCSDPQGRVPLSITVQDSGVGMSAAELQGLLKPAAQGEEAGIRRGGGTGLGLLITRRLVELMGGTLDVQSRPGAGSSFEIRLPLPPDPDGASAPPLPAQRVLLAEAAEASRQADEALLRHLGLGAGLAVCADVAGTLAALAEARESGRPFDWLLLDWLLPGPGATAAELLAQLRRDHPALRIAVLCPPGANDGAAQAVRGFGARALCPSPPLPQELRSLLGSARPAADRPAGIDAQSLAGLRVLLVEDHPVNQEIALRLLGSRGARVDVAGDGQQALDKLFERGADAYDLVLMDLQMPVLDGLSAARRLRERPEFDALPVLAMTAHAMAEERAECAAAGMQGHIAKPLDLSLLVRELQPYRPAPSPPPPSPVLDMPLGLRQLDGQAVLYRRTLQGFDEQYAAGLASWSAWLAGSDWSELRRGAHTLQGLAATVGALPLHKAALALERSAAASDASSAHDQLARVQTELTLVLAEVRAALERPWGAAAPRATGPGDVAELAQLLAHSDSRALDWWQAHGAHSGLAPELQQRLQSALAALDFDAAALALRGGA